MKHYELIEHTADIGIKVRGKDLTEVFINAAVAMFDIIAQPCVDCNRLKPKELKISLQAEDKEELFIEWLNELLSLSEAKETIFSDFKISSLTENKLEAIASGHQRENYTMNTEIKAATYHELKIEKLGSEWRAQIIFDV